MLTYSVKVDTANKLVDIQPNSCGNPQDCNYPKLSTLLDALHSPIDLTTDAELKYCCELIVRVQTMTGAEQDCIKAAFTHGPLFDGDVPSKLARDQLLKDGYLAKVVMKGEDGYSACTHKGAQAYRLLDC